jgi:hypothetical protein
MGKYASVLELAQKADDEGGVASFVFGYGIDMDDLPPDLPAHIRAFFRQLNAVKPSLQEVSRYLDGVATRFIDADTYRDY